MSSISKVKLPDNTALDIHDVRITGVDTTPTSSSTNVITSGAVYSSLPTALTNNEIDTIWTTVMG